MNNEPQDIEELLEAIIGSIENSEDRSIVELYLRKSDTLTTDAKREAIKILRDRYPEVYEKINPKKKDFSWIRNSLLALGIAVCGITAYFEIFKNQDLENLVKEKDAEIIQIKETASGSQAEQDRLIQNYEQKLQKQASEHEKEKQDMLAKPQEDKEKESAALLNKFETALNRLGFGRADGKMDDEMAGIEAFLKNTSDYEKIKASYETAITEKDQAIQALQAESSNAKNILSELEKKINEIGSLLENANTENTKLKEAYARLENIFFVGLTAYRRQPNGVHYVLFRLHFQDGDNVSKIMEDKKYYISREIAEKIGAVKILSSGEFNKSFERLWIKAEYKGTSAQHTLISEDRNGKTIQSKTIQREKIIEFIKSVLSRYTK